ncbi:TetR/AcrR family transcriptional regulator C-terminal domain-containing protein [Actinomyces polynesiensis]|uniref:TetR/AcrR family transcriptional regulator C-terminal domain-containing protein n=1 Tax=Actinomyces polynesiensis TaxID=1325934 RepID=UPI0005BE84A7|nr:TetR/AcrR family transcriptional regulator C-terminal domain-containing protein [Actinomyces polynesiensis]
MTQKLSRGSIVGAAFEVLDEVGLTGLTVRAVASRLGVRAPALYWHVRGKQDLLDGMSTELWRRILAGAPTNASTDWGEELRAFATVMRSTLLGVRDGAKVFGGAYMTDSSLLVSQEQNLGALAAQGLDPRRAALSWQLVYDFTLGFCIEEQEVRQSSDGRYDLEERDARIDADQHPLAAQFGRQAFGDPDTTFEDLLDILLAGVRTPGH